MTFVLLFFVCYMYGTQKKLIESWIEAAIIWVGLAYFSLECLSLCSAITFLSLFIFWLLMSLIMIMYIWKKGWGGVIKRFLLIIYNVLRDNKIWVFLSAGLLIMALTTVPYNWDSMTYHFARIANWAQNQSVAHYTTSNVKQLVNPMLAEFVSLHVYVLSGENDYFFNLPQCISALINVWLVYEIAKKIGCTRFYAQIAAFIFYTCPIAFGEALATQGDQFTGLWLLIFVYYYLDMIDEEYNFIFDRKTIKTCLIMGICISYGYLSKPSVLIGVAFFVLALFVQCIRRKDSVLCLAKLLFLVVPVMVIILVPELLRNIYSFGSISVPGTGQRQLVGTLSPLYVLVNGLKNYAFNLPTIYIEKSDHYVAAIVYLIARALGVAIDDPSIAEDGRVFSLHVARTYGHDTAVNPVIGWGLIFCMPWVIYRIKRMENKKARFYIVVAVIAFLLFCCTARWEPFVSRYMVGYLALICPVLSYLAEDFALFKQNKVCTWPAAILIFVCCVELVGLGTFHIKVILSERNDRFKGYFHNCTYIYDDYQEVCDLVLNKTNEGDDIGLLLKGNAYEYPIWQGLRGHGYSIRHIMISNQSSKYEKSDFIPDFIIASQGHGESLEYKEKKYYLCKECEDNAELCLYYSK